MWSSRAPADVLFILSWVAAIGLALISRLMLRDAEGLGFLLVYVYWAVSLALAATGMALSLVVAHLTKRHLMAWKWGVAAVVSLGSLGLAIAGIWTGLDDGPDGGLLFACTAMAVVGLVGCWAALATVPKSLD